MSDPITPKKVTPFDLFKQKTMVAVGKIEPLDKAISDARYAICQGCPFLRKKTHTCEKCNCFMPQKTTLPGAWCPEHKWEVATKDSDGLPKSGTFN